MNQDSSSLYALSDFAVMQAVGPDAVSFLQGQLTQDVASLSADRARLAGYCTAKGRLLANMVVWRGTESDAEGQSPVVYALMKADIVDSVLKRLSMFVLRAKVELQRCSLPVFGFVMPVGTDAGSSDLSNGDRANGYLAETAGLPSDPEAWQLERGPKGSWIAAPTLSGMAQRWLLVPREAPAASEFVQNDGAGSWEAADIAAGIPWIHSATQDLFIPQTLNLDLVDAVSFTKGCYPGQEVVARSHYRGTVKRRMAYGIIQQQEDVAKLDPHSLPGVDTYNALKPDSPCGRVVNAASVDEHSISRSALDVEKGLHLLMEVQLADLGQADFRLGAADGAVIKVTPLPYEIVIERQTSS